MDSRTERNVEQIKNVQYKVSNEFKRLSMTSKWLEEKDEIGGKVGEYATLGTNDNKNLLVKSSLLPVAPLAFGIVTATVGLVAMLPMLGGGPAGPSEEQFFKDISNFGTGALGLSYDSLLLSLKLALVPLGITVLSIPKKLLRTIKEKYNNFTNPFIVYDESILELIEDILNEKNDPTLEFPKTFLRRVNISNCSTRFNRRLFELLTYYRFCLQEIEENNMNEMDAKEAFDDIVSFLKEAKNKPYVPIEFKNNRFVNLLVDEFGYKEEDFHKTK